MCPFRQALRRHRYSSNAWLLQGAWFPQTMNYGAEAGPITSKSLSRTVPSSWRYVRLSHNRRYLHYADFEEKAAMEPRLDALQEKSKC